MSWPPAFPLFPIREPKRPEGHPLQTHLYFTEVEDARVMLSRIPPTAEELAALAAEELEGRDRADIYRLLAEFKPK